MARKSWFGATLVIGATWLAALATAAPPAPARPQVLRTVDGRKLVASVEGKTVKARPADGAGALKDGTYKLDNGGEVRIRGGEVIWDAFGAVERVRKHGAAQGPIGLG